MAKTEMMVQLSLPWWWLPYVALALAVTRIARAIGLPLHDGHLEALGAHLGRMAGRWARVTTA